MKTDKDLADELDAQDRLKRRGFRKVTCTACNGIGEIVLEKRVNDTITAHRCYLCDGKGYKWESPLMC